jgi:hypothetical protein
VSSVHFAGNCDGDRNFCDNCPAPPWVDPGDEDSAAVQSALHALFQMPLYGGPFQGSCFTVPGREETSWMQVRKLSLKRAEHCPHFGLALV